MKNNIVTYLFTAIIAVMFSACGADTTSTSYNPDSSTPTEDSSYSPNENPIASTVTSFAQDLALYDIASLDESSRAIRKADTAQDNGSDDKSNDDSSNDDGSNDKSNDDSSNDTNSNDDSDDESSEDDDSSDESSDDESNDDDSSNDDSSDSDSSSDTTSSTQTTQPEVTQPDVVEPEYNIDQNQYLDFSTYGEYQGEDDLDYETLGTVNVSLNNKSYRFKIAKDNFQERVQTPSFTSVGDGSFTIAITSYIITDDDILRKEDGIFTLVITVPSLNTSGSYPVEANVLTNSAQDTVYAQVNVSQDENGIIFNAMVSEFEVFNRTKTKSYSASFAVQYDSK